MIFYQDENSRIKFVTRDIRSRAAFNRHCRIEFGNYYYDLTILQFTGKLLSKFSNIGDTPIIGQKKYPLISYFWHKEKVNAAQVFSSYTLNTVNLFSALKMLFFYSPKTHRKRL